MYKTIKRNPMHRPANQSAGILDDHAVRKNMATKEGTIEHVPTNNNHIVNKLYVDNTINSRIADGTVQGQMVFYDATLGKWVHTETSELFWDDTNKYLGVGTASPDYKTHIVGELRVQSANYAGMMLLGADAGTTTVTTNHNKQARIAGVTYGNSYTMGMFSYVSESGRDRFVVGSQAGNTAVAPTEIYLNTAITKGVSGSTLERIKIDTGRIILDDTLYTERVTSRIGIGTSSPDTKFQVVGDTKLGDDNTNYASFATDGELTLTGTARVYKNQWINVQGLKAPGTKPASAVDWGISCAWEFSDGTDDTVCTSIRIPQDMDRTVAPELKIGFASDTNTGDVVWQLEYLYLTPNEDTTASAQETLTTTTTISSTTDGLTIATITGMDLPSSTDQLIKMRIKRLGGDGDDTLSDDVAVVGLGLKYVSDKLGIGL